MLDSKIFDVAKFGIICYVLHNFATVDEVARLTLIRKFFQKPKSNVHHIMEFFSEASLDSCQTSLKKAPISILIYRESNIFYYFFMNTS
jgi:hypothetical protein